MTALRLVTSGRRKAELQVLCKASFGTEIFATLQSRRRINFCRYKKKKVQQYYVRSAWRRMVENNELQKVKTETAAAYHDAQYRNFTRGLGGQNRIKREQKSRPPVLELKLGPLKRDARSL
jgi:hypothetical protein